MCGRYAFSDVEESFAAREIIEKALQLLPGFSGKEIFPSEPAPVIIPAVSIQSNAVVPGDVAVYEWGYPLDKKRVINARAETVLEKPFFARDYFAGRRCLVPASGYFEWQKDGLRKTKLFIRAQGFRLMYFAGLYNVRTMPDKTHQSSFVVVTANAAPGIAHIHNRMPLILNNDAARLWLYEKNAGYLLQPAETKFDIKIA